jgi:alpha-1,2-mannosyltransferase
MPYVLLEKGLANYDDKLLLANSYFTAKATADAWGVIPEVLYPPIPSAMFDESNVLLEPRENLVVTLARFGQGKEVELIPKIASLTDKNIKYLMIGLAHDPKVIKDVEIKIRQLQLEDRVTILTNASRQEIKSKLSRAKVYLHTKKDEHFGISIAEAMAMGCLPVVHNSGGAPEFVPDQYRYNEMYEAAAIVENAVHSWNSEKAQKMMEIAVRFSETNFSNRFAKLFTEYCDSREK